MVQVGTAPGAAAELDPRVERSRRVILGAVLDELGEVGYGALTIEAVAARAGVGKSTIYRHWPGKLELVEDAFRTLKAPVAVPDQGSLRERVVAVV
jgi:AcrR family transcriptional regulator